MILIGTSKMKTHVYFTTSLRLRCLLRESFLGEMGSDFPSWREVRDNWEDFVDSRRDLLVRMLRRGIPSKYRGDIWYRLSGAEHYRNTVGIEYRGASNPSAKYSTTIENDIVRTFPNVITRNDEVYLSGLRRILTVYSVVDSEVGYTQGMSYIAGMLLLYMEEEDAFWSFYGVMNRGEYPHRDFFKPSFPLLHQIAPIVGREIDRRFPKVAEYLNRIGIQPIIFLPMWFMSIFMATPLDLPTVVSIFDQYMAYGLAPLFSFGFAMIDIHLDLCGEGEGEYFLSVLTSPGRSERTSDRNRVNRHWIDNWVTTRELEVILKGGF